MLYLIIPHILLDLIQYLLNILVDFTAQEIQTQRLQENVQQDIIALMVHRVPPSSQRKKGIMLKKDQPLW